MPCQGRKKEIYEPKITSQNRTPAGKISRQRTTKFKR